MELNLVFPNVEFGENIQIIGLKSITIGKGSCIGDNTWINDCVRDKEKRIVIGEKVLVGRQSMISSAGTLEIGDYCLFAPRVYISNADHNYMDIAKPIVEQGATLDKSLVIEENCWIGINTVITGSVTIGRGSVIGANTVVNKDIPPFSVVVGNPFKIVKMYSTYSKQWEKIDNQNQIDEILKQREVVRLSGRKEYLETLRKNSNLDKLDEILAGKGINI